MTALCCMQCCYVLGMYAIAYWVTKYLLNCKQVTDILTTGWAATDGCGTGVICVIWSHSGEWARYSSRVVGHSASAYEGEREEGEWWLAGVHLIVTHGVDVLVSCVTEWHQTWHTAPSMYIPTHDPHIPTHPHICLLFAIQSQFNCSTIICYLPAILPSYLVGSRARADWTLPLFQRACVVLINILQLSDQLATLACKYFHLITQSRSKKC